MKQIYEYDNDGFFVGVKLIEDTCVFPSNCTETRPKDGLFKAKFVDGAWIETLSVEEIEEKLTINKPKTQLEILQETVDQLVLDNLMRGF